MMDPYRLVEIRRFYRALVPRLRKDPAPLNSMERAAVEKLMGELIAAAQTNTRK